MFTSFTQLVKMTFCRPSPSKCCKIFWKKQNNFILNTECKQEGYDIPIWGSETEGSSLQGMLVGSEPSGLDSRSSLGWPEGARRRQGWARVQWRSTADCLQGLQRRAASPPAGAAGSVGAHRGEGPGSGAAEQVLGLRAPGPRCEVSADTASPLRAPATFMWNEAGLGYSEATKYTCWSLFSDSSLLWFWSTLAKGIPHRFEPNLMIKYMQYFKSPEVNKVNMNILVLTSSEIIFLKPVFIVWSATNQNYEWGKWGHSLIQWLSEVF